LNNGHEPNYVYYFGQSKHFEEWYIKRKKDDQGPIYKDFEEKTTFEKYIFKERNYDKHSILIYDNNDKNIKISVENFKNTSNEIGNNIEDLIKKFEGNSSIEKIGKVENMKIDLKDEIKKLQLKLMKLEKLNNNNDDDYDNINMSIEKFKNINKEVSNNIQDLIKRFEDKNSIKKIKQFDDVKIDLKAEVEKLQLKFNKFKKLLL
jgi:hypothetical protein